MDSFALLFVIVAVALVFDLCNGWHDGANSISVVVYTGAMKPRTAVAMSALFNFLGPFVVGTAVAQTIGGEVIPESYINANLVLAALVSAISWDVLTWWRGLPVSSSQALVGGLVGAGMAAHGLNGVNWFGVFSKVLVPMALSPLIGLGAGYFFMKAEAHFVQSSSTAYHRLQVGASALLSLSHGANDAQKSMGIIAVFLAAYYGTSFNVPLWVVIACSVAMAIGTYMSIRIWRIVRTVGERITHLEARHGCAANLSSTATIFVASLVGAPVSTTHVVTSSVAGVGVASDLSTVSWPMVREILMAWVVTLPVCIVLSGAVFYLADLIL